MAGGDGGEEGRGCACLSMWASRRRPHQRRIAAHDGALACVCVDSATQPWGAARCSDETCGGWGIAGPATASVSARHPGSIWADRGRTRRYEGKCHCQSRQWLQSLDRPAGCTCHSRVEGHRARASVLPERARGAKTTVPRETVAAGECMCTLTLELSGVGGGVYNKPTPRNERVGAHGARSAPTGAQRSPSELGDGMSQPGP